MGALSDGLLRRLAYPMEVLRRSLLRTRCPEMGKKSTNTPNNFDFLISHVRTLDDHAREV